MSLLLLFLSFFIALILTLALGDKVVYALISLKVGQPIRKAKDICELAPEHAHKAGTPTMGGILILLSTCIATLCVCSWHNLTLWICLSGTIILSLLGFIDDFLKVKYNNPDGISGKAKLIIQALVGLTIGTLLYNYDLAIILLPGFGAWHAPLWFFLPFVTLTLMACSNAVNLTDGLDGLASGCTLATILSYLILIGLFITLFQTTFGTEQISTICLYLMALAGACLGFLWFNANPARMFMGDTGSLAIGGGLGIVTICTGTELFFLIIGAIFLMESLSVIIQVFYFKYTKRKFGEGKRFFRMAPIHHHFEKKGWKETQVFQRFWIMSLIAGLLGIIVFQFCFQA